MLNEKNLSKILLKKIFLSQIKNFIDSKEFIEILKITKKFVSRKIIFFPDIYYKNKYPMLNFFDIETIKKIKKILIYSSEIISKKNIFRNEQIDKIFLENNQTIEIFSLENLVISNKFFLCQKIQNEEKYFDEKKIFFKIFEKNFILSENYSKNHPVT